MELSNISTKISKEYNIKKAQTAKSFGSGGLENILSDNLTTVGSEFEIQHKKPTPINKIIKIKLKQKKVNDKIYKFTFSVEDSNSSEVASGTHTRVVVDKLRFLDRIK